MRAEDVGFELGPQGVAGDVFHRAGLAEAGVADEGAQAVARPLADFAHGGLDGGAVGDIQRDGHEALGAEGVEVVGLAGGGEHLPAGLPQEQGGCRSDAGGATGDQNRARLDRRDAHMGFIIAAPRAGVKDGESARGMVGGEGLEPPTSTV